MLNFYANQLTNLLHELPQLPIAIFPAFNSNIIQLNFDILTKTTKHSQAYQLFSYILAKYALIDVNNSNSLLITTNNHKFYIIYSPTSIKSDKNINETASLIMRLYILQQNGEINNLCSFDIYGPCILLPYEILERLNNL